MPCRFALALFLIAVTTPLAARGDDLFSLIATSSSTTARGAGSNVIDLVKNLTNNADQFAALGGQSFTSTLNYAGIANAVKVNQSFDPQGHRIINLQVPSVGLNKTFNEANGNLTDQVRDFLKTGGLAALGEFQAVVNRESLAGIVDGNPLAATAMLTDAGYEQFALHRSTQNLLGEPYTVATSGHGETRLSADGGVFDAGGFTGTFVDFTLASEVNFNDRIGLAASAPVRWLDFHGANVFMGGLILGLPITILPGHGDRSLQWQITPAGHAAAVGSADFASGGILYGGQIDNSLSYNFGDGFSITLGTTAGYFHGADISVAGYDFDTKLNQWVFKNGVLLSKAWDNFFIDGGASWTNFLRDAYTDGYLTPELGLGRRFGRGNNSGLRIGYTGHFGNHYNTNGGSVLLFFTG